MDADPRKVLSNVPDCLETGKGFLGADPGEELLEAARLTPPSYPFTVTAVRYTLQGGDLGGTACDNTQSHKVVVFVGAAVSPEATPAGAQTITVPAASGPTPANRVLEVALPSPVTLSAGQHLFAAVQVLPKPATCLLGCADNGDADRNYLSHKQVPPYDWTTTFAEVGVDVDFWIEALGN